jgi:hypothetical protein
MHNGSLLRFHRRIVLNTGCLILLVLSGQSPAAGQSNVPIISGGLGFLGSTEGGVSFFQPVLAPVIAIPIKDKLLIESRADLRGFIVREQGTTGPYHGQFFGTLEYLQLDYNANSHLTITAGRFLTPFGLFNERISPIWINKLQDAPFVAAIGTGIGYSDGFMLRGALISNHNYALNYSSYFSTLSTVNKFASVRAAGGRIGVFIPRTRLELGGSYQRRLQTVRMNSFGADLSWSPFRVPVEFKGEWAHSQSGHAYWVQTAYRLSQIHGGAPGLARLEPVFRMQQFFRSNLIADDSLPIVNSRRPEFGLNYYLPHEVRLNASYARDFFSQGTDINIWKFGVTHRFLFPLWPGESK